ncbi:YggS family pyridoxal phosphate-dependent enzyme [Candidatus Bipolaricaulota bacterium]|nr:YggS family pyridoxal phosphate-dependent enzyme [Candidatus Bipolaricaulota bacterium]
MVDTQPNDIAANVRRILSLIPESVVLVAAAKTRSVDEVEQVLAAGVHVIGENYLQEAEHMRRHIGDRGGVRWHMIGHLQRNKAKRAVGLFDLIETVDSIRLAVELDRHSRAMGKTQDILIELNSAAEPGKSGVLPGDVEPFARELMEMDHLRICGLMTMGPATATPEEIRPWFRVARREFDLLRAAAPRTASTPIGILSMGMSDSYSIAIDEGATSVRIGTALFGPRRRAEVSG